MLRAGITLYFVRHGETDWNRDQRYQGQRDIPINATGAKQARSNGLRLAAWLGERAAAFDYVSSPLRRARESMEILRTALGLDADAYLTDARLMEINYGSWEGQRWQEMAEQDAEGYRARLADIWNWQPAGGESYRMLTDRVGGWLQDIGRDTVVVAHGGVSRALRALVLRLNPSEAMRLEVPQDRILVVESETARWL
jgi:probable phosphoglycerate mutase